MRFHELRKRLCFKGHSSESGGKSKVGRKKSFAKKKKKRLGFNFQNIQQIHKLRSSLFLSEGKHSNGNPHKIKLKNRQSDKQMETQMKKHNWRVLREK